MRHERNPFFLPLCLPERRPPPIDINGDGVLSMEEVQTLLPDLSDEDLFAADTNADGVLDEAEYQILIDG